MQQLNPDLVDALFSAALPTFEQAHQHSTFESWLERNSTDDSAEAVSSITGDRLLLLGLELLGTEKNGRHPKISARIITAEDGGLPTDSDCSTFGVMEEAVRLNGGVALELPASEDDDDSDNDSDSESNCDDNDGDASDAEECTNHAGVSDTGGAGSNAAQSVQTNPPVDGDDALLLFEVPPGTGTIDDPG